MNQQFETFFYPNYNEVISAQLDPANQLTVAMDGYKLNQQPEPFVRVLVQPQGRALRFRYKCEGRYPGALTGYGSTAENKTYPTIRVENYVGKFAVVISCVTKDPPYRPHPHNIVSKEACKDGVYRNRFDRSNMTAQFTSLGIQCVKKTEVKDSLLERQKLRIDPFDTHYDHMNRLGDIDLNAVRLCFQVFIEDVPGSEKFTRALHPVVSEVIYDRKAMSDLLITKLSHTLAPLQGGLEMIVLCDKVSKDDIEIYFYQEDSNGHFLWEEKADILSVHKQVAVCFRSPNCSQHFPVGDDLHLVKVHLRRSRVNELGEGRDIFLMSVSGGGNNEMGGGGAKRKRLTGQDPHVQVQMELLQQQGRAIIPIVVPVPRYEASPEPRYAAPSPKSDDSSAQSPQWMMHSPRDPVYGNNNNNNNNNNNIYGTNGSEMVHILPDAGPGPANPQEIASVSEKLDSLLHFNSNDINLNNLNIEEFQMSGPSATPVNGNVDTGASNFSVPNLSASMFESETSLGRLDLLDSEKLRELKDDDHK